MKTIFKIFLTINLIAFLCSITIIKIVETLIVLNQDNSNEMVELQKVSFSPFKKIDKTIIVKQKNRKEVSKFDSTIYKINISEKEDLAIPFKIDTKAGKIYRKIYSGRRINIALIGIDSKIGERFKLADANHIISLLPETRQIEIYSIPRDTKVNFAEEDSLKPKILSRYYSKVGKNEYLRKLAEISELDKVHYWVEVGFSQVIGLLDFFGYRNPSNTLQVLRSRKIFKGGDYQRVYNQANFLKYQLNKNINYYNEQTFKVILNSVLSLLNNNCNSDTLFSCYQSFRSDNFPPSNINIQIKPSFKFKYKDFDFSNDFVLTKLESKVSGSNRNYGLKVYKTLDSILVLAQKDSIKHPILVISKLEKYFEQKAWLQIPETEFRNKIRNRFKGLLSSAYSRKNYNHKLKKLLISFESEENLNNLNQYEKITSK
ncbi:hypothetical protein OAQ99_00580 [Candidatus Kapabacteria bacterium]|nr:hypothetical protein [Candidatus Kapabacteria bacterium]